MNPEIVARFTAAFASRLDGGAVIVGRDSRSSGSCLAPVVFSTLRFFGIDVVDLGIVPTPTVGIMVGELGGSGGIVITASHNGPEWNALKLIRADGEFLSAPEMEAVIALATGDGTLFPAPARFGALRADRGADDVHVRRILDLELVDPERIRGLGLTAAIDCVNGAGSVIVPALLRRLGVEVIELFTDTDAPFPHVPEPRPENLGSLSGAVREGGADIGFACDPDADRLVLVDGTGRVCSEELTLALAADFVLRHERGPIAANLSTSRLVDDIGRAHGVPVHRSKVGEAHVIELMKRTGAVIGGEGNGGVIYPKVHYGRDALTGIALVLQLLAEEGVPLRELTERFHAYRIVKRKVRFEGDLGEVASELRKRFPGRITDIDGMRIDMERAWVHVRSSNTEPVVRIIAEAETEEAACELADGAEAVLRSRGDTA
jgi:phosphomannomutase